MFWQDIWPVLTLETHNPSGRTLGKFCSVSGVGSVSVNKDGCMTDIRQDELSTLKRQRRTKRRTDELG